LCVLPVCVLACLLRRTAEAAADLPNIAINDNRAPAGVLSNGVLVVHLEIAQGLWHPEAENRVPLSIYAFGESGKPLQNPGPLLRVPQGTQIQATIHNALSVAVTLHGFHARPGDEQDAVSLPPGATHSLEFSAGAPGTYFYWATTSGKRLNRREPIESQLAGALVIDPPGAVAPDRVFVIGVWYRDIADPFGFEVPTINGKSWPYTERFTFRVGEPVHWRWINPSGSDHAMHLHGFYYRLDAVGDAEHSLPYAESERPLIVTKFLPIAGTFDMTWVPERSGRWLFHCHMVAHMSPPEMSPGLAPAAAHPYEHGAEPDSAGMAGLVLGITVQSDKSSAAPPVWHAERKLQLILSERKDGRPLYQVEVRDPAQPPSTSQTTPADPPLIGPPLVLTQNQPVEIEVVNNLNQPTSIHWHGIELESYYDGVAGWTGTPTQISPPVPPGKTFLARMAPPRAGTFIYHTHWHDAAQLENGIYGPLIVLPPGEKLDPARDFSFVFALGDFGPAGELLLINGTPQPGPLRLTTGVKYRLRLINIAPSNVAMRASLLKSGVPVQWRALAKDGADLPPAAATLRPAETGITVGETYDFEFLAASPQELLLDVFLPGPQIHATQVLVFAPPRPAP
jgi:FtsP/CotA-like multicopper oxidase with cupredoxin domain